MSTNMHFSSIYEIATIAKMPADFSCTFADSVLFVHNEMYSFAVVVAAERHRVNLCIYCCPR